MWRKRKNIFLIEDFLNNSRWSKSKLARNMWLSRSAIGQYLRRWAQTIWKREEYSNCFNKMFWTDYTIEYLFKKVKNETK